MDIGFYIVQVFVPLVPVFLWFFSGRDPKIKEGPITSWYEAPKHADGTHFSPAEAGLLFDESIDDREIVATLVELMRKGFITFEEETNTLIFEYLKERTTLTEEEIKLIHSIFQGSQSVVLDRVDWQLVMRAFRTDVINRLMTYGYFSYNPYLVQAGFILVSLLIARFFDIPFLYITMFFSLAMSKRTELGRKQYVILVSFRNFLNSQKLHWKFQMEHQKGEDAFLPYAIAMNVASKWNNKFAAIERDLRRKDRHATVKDLVEPVKIAGESLMNK